MYRKGKKYYISKREGKKVHTVWISTPLKMVANYVGKIFPTYPKRYKKWQKITGSTIISISIILIVWLAVYVGRTYSIVNTGFPLALKVDSLSAKVHQQDSVIAALRANVMARDTVAYRIPGTNIDLDAAQYNEYRQGKIVFIDGQNINISWEQKKNKPCPMGKAKVYLTPDNRDVALCY